MKKQVYIAAGGTGGHINAAISIGETLKNDYEIKYLSGTRYLDYQLFKNMSVFHLDSKPLRTKNPLKLLINICFNLNVFINILFLYLKKRPAFLIGAGGYICGPTLLAGKLLGIPIFIIEQNAVVGVTNKILSKIANLIFTNFKETKGIGLTNKVIHSGNPIRAKIRNSKNKVSSNEYNILVFGGSLGATQINESIIELIQNWQGEKLNIIHQVGKANINSTVQSVTNINYKQLEYIDNMDELYEWSNIIVSRAGASTVSELRVVKRPAIIIPFPAATDNHQYYNALELKEEKLFHVDVLNQKLKGKELAQELSKSLNTVIANEIYFQKDLDIVNAADKIKNEIIKYVRN